MSMSVVQTQQEREEFTIMHLGMSPPVRQDRASKAKFSSSLLEKGNERAQKSENWGRKFCLLRYWRFPKILIK